MIDTLRRALERSELADEVVRRLAARLDAAGIEYGVAGDLATEHHGCRIHRGLAEILTNERGVAFIDEQLVGNEYERTSEYRIGERATGFSILVHCGAVAAERVDGIAVLPLWKFCELRLDMTARYGSLKWVGDVETIIWKTKPRRDVGDAMAPPCREKYYWMWDVAQSAHDPFAEREPQS